MKFAVAISAAMFVLGGCGSSSVDSEAVTDTSAGVTTQAPSTTTQAPPTTTLPPSTTTSQAPVDNGFESVFDIRQVLEDNGFPCPIFEVRATPRIAIESADCTGSSVIGIFENASDPIAEMQLRYDMFSWQQVSVTGRNWAVSCKYPSVDCVEIQNILAGEITIIG